jgi:hypothetical protein
MKRLDWEDGLVLVGALLVLVAIYWMYGAAGVVGTVGLLLLTAGVGVAIWRQEQGKRNNNSGK